jgi:hypothetical protein
MSAKAEKSEQFSGKSDGITFKKLDEKVLSWGHSKFGDKYSTLLWKDELTDLTKLDLNDELDAFEWDMHCTVVHDVLCYDSANGDNCRHSHEGKKGGKRKSSLVLSKKEKKKVKKEVAAMVVKNLKSAHGSEVKNEGKFEEDDKDSLYNLVRGKSSLMVQRLDEDNSEDFVPRRVLMMISSEESGEEEFLPIRDHKNTDKDSEIKIKRKEEKGLDRGKSISGLEEMQSQSKSAVSSTSPFTRASRRPRPSSDAKLQSSSSSATPKSPQYDSDEPIGPRARHLLDVATKRLKVTEDFISSMSKYLNQQSTDMEAQQKRRNENESRRQLELLGVEDPQEREELKLSVLTMTNALMNDLRIRWRNERLSNLRRELLSEEKGGVS